MENFNVLNWPLADFSTPEGSKKIQAAINHFMAYPRKKADSLAVKHFASRADFPADGYPFLEILQKEVPADMGWTRTFKTIDFTAGNGAGGESGFDALARGSSVVLAEVKTGQKAKVFPASGNSVRIPFVLYGGGISYERTLVEDGRWWDMEVTLLNLRNAYYTALAGAHYALLEAIGAGGNIAWQNPTPAALANTDPNYTRSRDGNTINAAILAIITAAEGWGGISKDSGYVVTAPLALASRLRSALGNDTVGNKLVNFNVELVTTTNLAASDVYYVAPVEAAARSGMRLDYEVEFDKDVLARSESAVAWSRFGAAVLHDLCIRRCATA